MQRSGIILLKNANSLQKSQRKEGLVYLATKFCPECVLFDSTKRRRVGSVTKFICILILQHYLLAVADYPSIGGLIPNNMGHPRAISPSPRVVARPRQTTLDYSCREFWGMKIRRRWDQGAPQWERRLAQSLVWMVLYSLGECELHSSIQSRLTEECVAIYV